MPARLSPIGNRLATNVAIRRSRERDCERKDDQSRPAPGQQAGSSGQYYETTDEEAEYLRLMTVGWTEEQKIESDRES